MGLSPTLYKAIRNVCTAQFTNLSERQMRLNPLRTVLPNTYNHIVWEGSAAEFANRLVDQLQHYPDELDIVLRELCDYIDETQCEEITLLNTQALAELHADPSPIATKRQTNRASLRDTDNTNLPANINTVPPSPEPLLTKRGAKVTRFLLLALGAIIVAAALWFTAQWLLNDRSGYEPITVILFFIGPTLIGAAGNLQADRTARPSDTPRWIRITLMVLGGMVNLAAIVFTVLWMLDTTQPYEPQIVLLFAVGSGLFTFANHESLGWMWMRLRRPAPEVQALEELQYGWIEGFLHTALRDVKQFGITLTDDRDMVVTDKETGDYTLPDSRNINKVFEAPLEGYLLVLGKPGAGKTITLLQLAETLMKCARANIDAGEPYKIPLVFNLSTWAQRSAPIPLRAWIEAEGQRSYGVRRKHTREWIANDDVILLLDGLDEIKAGWRDDYVAAINDFRREKPSVQMVVSSRIDEYEELSDKLNLNGAVRLRDLDENEVNAYLQNGGESLAGLRELVATDRIVHNMITVPFLLNTMVYTYAGQDVSALAGYNSPAQRRQHLFTAYVERRLDHARIKAKADKQRYPYTNDQVKRWLTYLATKMQITSTTAFKLSDINGNWLRSEPRLHRVHQWTLRVVGFVPPVVFAFALGWVLGNIFIAILLAMLVDYGFWMFIDWLDDAIIEQAAKIAFIQWKIESPELAIQGFTAAKVGFGLLILITISSGSFTLLFSISRWWLLSPFTAISLWVLYGGLIWLDARLSRMHITMNHWLPIRAGAMMQHMMDLNILRERSGGYQFIHRYLLESFAGDDEIMILIEALHDAVRKEQAIKQLVVLDERAVQPLITALSDKDQKVRVSVVEALGKIGEPVVQSLITALSDKDQKVRVSVVEALGKIGEPVVQPLITALSDDEIWIRSNAAKALGGIGDGRAVELLVKVLSDEVHWVRSNAAEALGKIGDGRAVEPLVKVLSDEVHWVRINAVKALGKIGDGRAVEPLVKVLSDEVHWVRSNAVEALALEKIGGEYVIIPLVTTLSDQVYWVRDEAAEALRKIGTPEALQALRDSGYDT